MPAACLNISIPKCREPPVPVEAYAILPGDFFAKPSVLRLDTASAPQLGVQTWSPVGLGLPLRRPRLSQNKARRTAESSTTLRDALPD